MILDLSELQKVGTHRELSTEVQLEDFDFCGRDVEVPEPLELNLEIFNTEESFVLTGSLKGEILLACSRCLEKFARSVDVELEEELEKEDIEDPENINLDYLFRENILLSVPIKPLCAPDCQGICPECGTNLNEEQCDCSTESVDPRLAKLKDLLNETE